MSNSRVQAIIPDKSAEEFDRLAKDQNRSRSNLAKRYIVEGILKDIEKEKERKNGK